LIDHGDGDFSLQGRVGLSNVGRLLASGRQQFSEHGSITINLTKADCASTVALALLLEWLSWCASRNIELAYEKPRADLLAVIEANDVAHVLPLLPVPDRNVFAPAGNHT
jgi:ABC-type transporter Mla MlaB component